MVLARGAVLVFAVLACAWFALGIRQAHDTGRASSILQGPTRSLSAAHANQAASLLHDAAFLNPDVTVKLLRAQLAADRGNKSQAESIALSAALQEPDNVQAWFALARHSPQAKDYIRALIEIHRLFPHMP